MNVPRNALAAGVALLIAVPIFALAQDTAAPKLYRWVGADGKAHYSDDLPPEALNQARQELSRNGITLKQVDRAQTTDERAATLAKVAADAKIAEAIEHAKQSDQVLLASYPNEAELERAYDERIALQNETLKGTRIAMQSQQGSLSSLLIAASNLELSGKPVSVQLAASILTTHAQMLEEQKSQMQQEAQATNLRQESAATMARYRSLRSAAEAERATPAPATTSTTSPPKS